MQLRGREVPLWRKRVVLRRLESRECSLGQDRRRARAQREWYPAGKLDNEPRVAARKRLFGRRDPSGEGCQHRQRDCGKPSCGHGGVIVLSIWLLCSAFAAVSRHATRCPYALAFVLVGL